MSACGTGRPRGRRRGFVQCAGYTLIEMMVAIIMFALISVATAFLLTAALRGQADLRRTAADAQEARALLSVITRDLRSAFVVTGSSSTYFVATGADSGPILQFTSLASRLMPEPTGTGSSDPYSSLIMPQSGTVQISYDYDPDTMVLSRVATTLPGGESYPESGLPDWILSRRVQSLSFTFVDADGNTRNEWNFQNAASEVGGEVSGSYDTTMPVRVDVELELTQGTAESVLFRTSIALANAEPQPAGQAPPAAPAQGGGGGGSGGGPGGGETP